MSERKPHLGTLPLSERAREAESRIQRSLAQVLHDARQAAVSVPEPSRYFALLQATQLLLHINAGEVGPKTRNDLSRLVAAALSGLNQQSLAPPIEGAGFLGDGGAKGAKKKYLIYVRDEVFPLLEKASVSRKAYVSEKEVDERVPSVSESKLAEAAANSLCVYALLQPEVRQWTANGPPIDPEGLRHLVPLVKRELGALLAVDAVTPPNVAWTLFVAMGEARNTRLDVFSKKLLNEVSGMTPGH